MAFKTPPQIAEAAVELGVAKAETSPDKLLLAGALAGAYIALGGLFGLVVTSGLNPVIWGSLPSLINGAAFAFGLMLVVITGAELVTGAAPYPAFAALKGRIGWGLVGRYVAWTTVGALAGSLFVAYFLATKSGVLSNPDVLKRITAVATFKGQTETDWQIFLRGIGCNWLVCLAVWMALASEDIVSKIASIFFPIMAFVAMGFDHLVANMFILPAAHFAGAPIPWSDITRNWLWAGLGNAVAAFIFFLGAQYYMYGRAAVVAKSAADAAAANGAGSPEPEFAGVSA